LVALTYLHRLLYFLTAREEKNLSGKEMALPSFEESCAFAVMQDELHKKIRASKEWGRISQSVS
jgi:hypothetical protein